MEDGGGEPSFPDDLVIDLPVEEFTEFVEFDLSEQFERLGVDVKAVMDRKSEPNLGPFQSRTAFIYGLLEFTDEDGQSRAFRFGTDMRIDGPLYGMYGPPTFEYQTRLRVDGEDYKQSVDISHVIKPDESDRFLLQLDVDKSSNHELVIEILGNNGSLSTSVPMMISIFVPRSVHKQVADTETPNSFFFN